MEQGFIDILKQIVKEQGRAALTDARKCKGLLIDYTKNEYKKESSWLVQAVEAGVAKAIDGVDDLASCKKAQIKVLEEEKGLSSAVATDIVDALARVLIKPAKGKIELWGGVYEGDLVNGEPYGHGKLTQGGGSEVEIYEGDWVDGRFQGKGKKSYDDSVASMHFVYEGDFFEGNEHGKGKFTDVDGSVYEGDWVNGLKHGKGKLIDADGNIYVGDFVKNKFHGKGKLTHADGRVQEGDWKEGNFAIRAKGKLTFGSVGVWEGDVIDGKPDGVGKMTRPDGHVYDCKFVDGKMYLT
jgi:hypothetical protein